MSIKPVILPISLQPSNLRPFAYRILSKKHGLNIKSDALKTLADYVGRKFGIEWRSAKGQLFLEEVAKVWKEQERGIFLESAGLEDVLKELEALESRTIKSNGHHNQHTSVESLISKTPFTVSRESTRNDESEEELVSRTSPATSVTPPPLSETLNWKDYFRVINANEQPIFEYNTLRKQYELLKNVDSKFSSSAVDFDISLFQKRFSIIKDRLLRNENFQTNTFNPLSSVQLLQSNSITQIKNLIGRNNQRFLLFGMLTLLNGEWHLQDTSDKILLDLNQTEPNSGSFYVPGNMVLCDGIYASNTFYCSSIGHPPGERRNETLEANGDIDFLGIHANLRIDKDLNQRLKILEKELDHKIIILGSDCFLDDLKVLDALNKFFAKLSEDENDIPVSIIFNGSFVSSPKHSTEYKEVFDTLASILEKHPVITGNINLVFIPGDNDQWQTPIWPKQSIPKIFGSRLSRLVRNITWATNPTRMVYLSREIVLSRDNIGARFRRHTVIFPSSETPVDDSITNTEIEKIESLPPRVSEARKVVKTLLDQGHLSPFTKDLQPVIWHLDHVLTMSPIPSILILADPTSPSFDVTYNGCRCLNPGKLIEKRKLNYIELHLSSQKAQLEELYF